MCHPCGYLKSRNKKWLGIPGVHVIGKHETEFESICGLDRFYLCLLSWKVLSAAPREWFEIGVAISERCKIWNWKALEDCSVPFSHFTDEVTDSLRISFERKKVRRVQKPGMKDPCWSFSSQTGRRLCMVFHHPHFSMLWFDELSLQVHISVKLEHVHPYLASCFDKNLSFV